MKKITLFLVLFFAVSGAAFADSERILPYVSQPYDSLGSIELRVGNTHSYLKYMTAGLLRKRAYKRMTRQLDKKLLKEARKKYGADAIANVIYWPSPDSGETVDYLYGRAEMVRFKKFPPPAVPVVPAVKTVEPSTL